MSEVIGATESAGLEAQLGTERPLTDEERATVQRLLSDPFSYPQQFKTWLISFLEGSDLLLARSSVQGLSSLLGSGGGQGVLGLLPAGLILPYGGVTAPVGALLCNGAPYSRTGYKRLFDAIGSTYGAGDGSSTFNVPDLRRRLPLGQGTGMAVGASDLRAEAQRHIDHHHGFGQTSGGGGAHGHSVSGSVGGGGGHDHAPGGGGGFAKNSGQTAQGATGTGWTRYNVIDWTSGTDWEGDHGHGWSGSVGGVGDHTHFVSGDTSGGFDNNRPAFLVVGFIINY